MILNLGSLIFNVETLSGGGTPAWGTEMGQGEGYKFNFEDYQDLITSLVYTSIPNPQNRVTCPLGKGGNQASDYEFVLASLYDKIYVNGEPVLSSKFVLLVIKKLVGNNHVGRRTLKYNPRITLDGVEYNSHCFQSIATKLGVTNNGSWFISQIEVKNQDELHFTAHILDENNTYTFRDSADRSNTLVSKIRAYAESTKNNALKRFAIDCRPEIPYQLIYFGAPGTGKSHEINKSVNEKNSIRTTFHPDSDYSTFVGCYKPVKKTDGSNEITYDFIPQAFTNAYVNAWKDQTKAFFLVIEEINRGNCAQIFGDMFQLLDRNDNGFSSYKITPDQDLQLYLKKAFENVEIEDEEIKKGERMLLPGNLYILATMNTSDQSLFPIDSAFKRRWDWKYMPIDYTDNGHYISCRNKQYSWVLFLDKVNKRIESVTQSEDKKLGSWFVRPINSEITSERFVSKVVFYLWNDIFKDFVHGGSTIFKDDFDKFHNFFDVKGNVKEDVLERFLESLEVTYIEEEETLPESYNNKFILNDNITGSLGSIAKKVVEDYANKYPELNAESVKNFFVNICKGIGIAHIVETDEEYQARASQKSAERSRSELKLPNGERVHVSTQWNAKRETSNFIRFIEICKEYNLGIIKPIE